MLQTTKHCRIVINRCGRDERLDRDFQTFRRNFFVDRLGWQLSVVGGRERDIFDTPDAIYVVAYRDGLVAGGFRVIPCDRPYLAAAVFPRLADLYPETADHWEVSRLGAERSAQDVGGILYAVMLRLADECRVTSLVAVADLQHERLLRRIGIRSRRFGASRAISLSRDGRPLLAVAGEINLADQSSDLWRWVSALLQHVEISDEAAIFGPRFVPA